MKRSKRNRVVDELMRQARPDPGLFSAMAPDRPKCVFCERPALDGHLTCGRLECPEIYARAINTRRYVEAAAKSIDALKIMRASAKANGFDTGKLP